MSQTAPTRKEDRTHTVAREAETVPDVESATANTCRYPARVTVVIDGWTIPAGLHDRIDQVGAELVDAEAGPEALTVHLDVREPWRMAGVRSARKEGGSVVVAIPREAMEASGLETGDRALSARPGEIHITAQDEPVPPR
jgi:hypothetical protein